MRLYRVISPKRVRYAGSEVDARTLRLLAMKEENVKRTSTDVELIEVPTTKAELLDFLNKEYDRNV